MILYEKNMIKSNLKKLGCPSSKKKYKDESEALRAARDGMLLRNTPKLGVYQCMICYEYHLTSSIKETKLKKNSKRKR